MSERRTQASGGLVGAVHKLLDEAEPILERPAGRVAELRDRLDGPLRVAIAGKVKAGKSTLLNALVGEKVAPTDASECTRIVTWYRNSNVYRASAVPYVGDTVELPFRRTEHAFTVSLGDQSADELRYLDIEWPSQRLQDLILIDTPGLSSPTADLSGQTERYLSADEEGPGEADAVIYLMRHLHPMDLSFLEAFKDDLALRGASVNSIAVLSRADEVGACQPNALGVAERAAQRYRLDPRLQMLCQAVLPVAGLIAEAAATLREDETTALRRLAEVDRSVSVGMLRSAGGFVSSDDLPGLDGSMRGRLLDRLGLFGVRLAVELLIVRRGMSAGDLARELEARSGIGELRRILGGQFAARAAVLKARSTLASLLALAERHGGPQGRMIRDRVRDIERGAHELVEIRFCRGCAQSVSGSATTR
jgi:predicted GTPase